MNTPAKGIVYDAPAANRILGFPCECSDPIPEASQGEIVVYYGGWDLQQLRACPAGQKWMYQENWYDKYGWKAELGYYRLLLPVPDSNRQSWNRQRGSLLGIDPAWRVAPICVATAALLVHLAIGGSPLWNGWCRCAESAPPCGTPTIVGVYDGLVDICSDWNDGPDEEEWLAAVVKC